MVVNKQPSGIISDYFASVCLEATVNPPLKHLIGIKKSIFINKNMHFLKPFPTPEAWRPLCNQGVTTLPPRGICGEATLRPLNTELISLQEPKKDTQDSHQA